MKLIVKQLRYIFFSECLEDTPLNDFQKDQFIAYKNGGKGVEEITHMLLISPNPVSNFLRQPDREEKKKKRQVDLSS